MTILSLQQAINVLRCEETDPRVKDLLPQVDAFLKRATGRDWAQDTVKNPLAVSAATMLLVMWFDIPGQMGSQMTDSPLAFGLTNMLSQLEAESLKYRKVQFAGLSGAGSIPMPEAHLGDDVISLTGVYGVSGDQSAKFESEISDEGLLAQTSTDDLSDYLFVAVLKSPADDVSV